MVKVAVTEMALTGGTAAAAAPAITPSTWRTVVGSVTSLMTPPVCMLVGRSVAS